MDTPEIAAARQAYSKAAELFEQRIGQHQTAKQALADAQARLDQANKLYDLAETDTHEAFKALAAAIKEASDGRA